MKMTRYTNPHGLADKANHSTAIELAYLSSIAMKNALFRKIVNCKVYEGSTFYSMKRFMSRYP
jgi:D-alanyl-D-alanine carboxypeptidase